MVKMDQIPTYLEDIITFVMPRAHRNIAWNIVGKLIVSASVYFVWQERNIRLYRKGSCPPDQVV